jgi:uncharacterized protein (DUF1778 family)
MATEAQKAAIRRYEQNTVDRINVRLPKGTKDQILDAGAKSVNNFIIEAVMEKLETTQGDTEKLHEAGGKLREGHRPEGLD